MARKVKNYDISEIREFSSKTKYTNATSSWIPSVIGQSDSTFTLEGINPVGGGSSKGEINILTNFNQSDNEDINLKRFSLALYCLQNLPFFYENANNDIAYNKDDLLFSQNLEKFLRDFQTGNSTNPYSRSLTSDIVRTYRGTKLNDTPPDNEKSTQSLINYANSSTDYKTNVAGVLGKVSYDSIIKHTLYHLLISNGIIKDYQRSVAQNWYDEATKLEIGTFDLYVDVSGGPYKRAFPTICVFTKDKSGKSKYDFLLSSNDFILSKFLRNPNGEDQLVSPVPYGGEKNFLEYPIRDTGESVYCLIYDFVKVILLGGEKDQYTLDLLKIGLSVLSRKMPGKNVETIGFKNIQEFEQFYESISNYLRSAYPESLKEKNFSIKFPKKHSKECEYSLSKPSSNFISKFNNTFMAEIQQLSDSIESVYGKIVDTFKKQVNPGTEQNFQFANYQNLDNIPVFLHFDNFYNLLAVTTKNSAKLQKKEELNDSYPFVLEDYKIENSFGDLIKDFFKSTETLPTYANSSYQYTPSYATEHDIVLITEIFLKQLYEILDSKGIGIVYESEQNQNNDDALSVSTFNLLDLIENRTGQVLKKQDYLYVSSNKVYLKKEIVKVLKLKEFTFSFSGAKEDKVKLQTIGHFLFINKKDGADINDFQETIYYPKLKEKTKPAEGDKIITPTPKPVKIPQNNNFLINNIISSELACYEDIANSFDKALNSDNVYDTLSNLSKTLCLIGLPFLLAYTSKQLYDKLSKLSKTPVDPSTLDCLLQDADNLKKMILGFTDLATSENPEQLLLQYIPELPKIPQIPFISTFDLEKELKRRLVQFVIEGITSILKENFNLSIQSAIDMCNSDSYFNAFLDASFPKDSARNVNGEIASPSGLPAGTMSTIYRPEILVNINSLIEQSNIETLENVYAGMRIVFSVSEIDFSNDEIRDFFDYLSDKLSAGEILSLLRGSTTPQDRSVVLSYIRNYQPNKFYDIINDENNVKFLFEYLANYIDYRLIIEFIASSRANFNSSVCFDVNSKFDEYASFYPQDVIETQANELENSLNDACALKKPFSLNIFAGPSLMTRTLQESLNSAVEQIFSLDYKKVGQYDTNGNKKIVNMTGSVGDKYDLEVENRIKILEDKSKFVLQKVFNKILSVSADVDYSVYETMDDITYSDLAISKLYLKMNTSEDKNGSPLPFAYEDLWDLGNDRITEFFSWITWSGQLKQSNASKGNISPPDYNSLEGQQLDNATTQKYFNLPTLNLKRAGNVLPKFNKQIIDLWNVVADKPITNLPQNAEEQKYVNTFYGVDFNPFRDLYNLATYTDSFRKDIFSGVENKNDIETLKKLFSELFSNPSVSGYFKFALEIYKEASKIEKQFYGNTNLASLTPWYNLKIQDLDSYQFEEDKNKYSDSFKKSLKNGGNLGLKTEEATITGLLLKYEDMREQKAEVYKSEDPGEPGTGEVITFVE